MPAKIDQNLLPPVIRQSIDPDILNRAQSIEWSIDRDTGLNEHGYLDGSKEDQLSSQNLLPKTHGSLHHQGLGQRKSRKTVEWYDTASGRDSGFQPTPTSPSLGKRSSTGAADLSPLDDAVAPVGDFSASNKANSLGQMKRHPQGMSPFPIYRVNQEQLQGDVFFEASPRAAPGERTVYYEKGTRVMNEHEMDALGLDSNFFAPNTQVTVDEQEAETIETSVLHGGARELEELYNTMRSDAGEYFDRQRARSLSPSGSRRPVEAESSSQRKTTVFGSVGELDQHEQEYYPYRDAHQGKPLPGDNEYGTWGSRFDDQKQWKLCNGQWVRVAPPKPEPKPERYMAERLKCKSPRKGRAVSEPVRHIEPQGQSSDSETDLEPATLSDDDAELPLRAVDLEPVRVRAPPRRSQADLEPEVVRPARRRPLDLAGSPPVDLDALRDKYRPKVADDLPSPKLLADGLTKPSPKQQQPNDDYDDADDDDDDDDAGTILLEPIRPPTPPLEEIKVEPVQPVYVEMKKPLRQPDGEEEKLMEDPNLMWMRMGPAQYGPPFGSMKRRKAREEEWVGPPCELCHKQIEERRCMLAENMKFHCWHFACSFCLKTLKPADFLIAEADRKPYCLNCHKREFPEISLVGLHLEE